MIAVAVAADGRLDDVEDLGAGEREGVDLEIGHRRRSRSLRFLMRLPHTAMSHHLPRRV